MWRPSVTYLIFASVSLVMWLFAEIYSFKYLYKIIVSNISEVHFRVYFIVADLFFFYTPVFLVISCIVLKILNHIYGTYYKPFFEKLEKYNNKLEISPVIEEAEYQNSIAITKKAKIKRELNLNLCKLDLTGDFNSFISAVEGIYSYNRVSGTDLLIDFWVMRAFLELNDMDKASKMLKKYDEIKKLDDKKSKRMVNHYLYKLMCLEYDLYLDKNLNIVKKELTKMLNLDTTLTDNITIHYDLGILYLKEKNYTKATECFKYIIENGNEHFLVKKCEKLLKNIETK